MLCSDWPVQVGVHSEHTEAGGGVAGHLTGQCHLVRYVDMLPVVIVGGAGLHDPVHRGVSLADHLLYLVSLVKALLECSLERHSI